MQIQDVKNVAATTNRAVDGSVWAKLCKQHNRPLSLSKTPQLIARAKFDTSYKNLFNKPSESLKSSICSYKIASFDLECFSARKMFPLPQYPNDNIIMIGTTVSEYPQPHVPTDPTAVEFQVFDIQVQDYDLSATGSAGIVGATTNSAASVCVGHITGKTVDGTLVVIEFSFRPYLYIEFEYPHLDDKMLQSLCKQLRLSITDFTKTVMHCKQFVGFKHNTRDPLSNESQTNRYLFIEFKSKQLRDKISRYVNKLPDNKICIDNNLYPIAAYEASIDTVIQFQNICQVVPSRFVKVYLKDIDIIFDNRGNIDCKSKSDASLIPSLKPKLSRVVFTLDKHPNHDQVVKKLEKMQSRDVTNGDTKGVSNVNGGGSVKMRENLQRAELLEAKQLEQALSKEDLEEKQKPLIIYRFKTEIEMIIAWRNWLICEIDPDYIAGHNIHGFDFRYLYKRVKKFYPARLEEIFTLSRLPWLFNPLARSNFGSSAFKKRYFWKCNLFGRVQIDTQTWFFRNQQLESYTLKFLSTKHLKHTKLDVTPMQIFEYFLSLDIAKIDRTARYCAKDCDLVVELIDKFKIVVGQMSTSATTCTLQSRVSDKGQQERTMNLISKECCQRRFVINYIRPSKPWTGDKNKNGLPASNASSFVDDGEVEDDDSKSSNSDSKSADNDDEDIPDSDYESESDDESKDGGRKKTKGYTGAIVFEPKIGFYTGAVAVLDFASMYPYAERSKNMCPSTWVQLNDTNNPNNEFIRMIFILDGVMLGTNGGSTNVTTNQSHFIYNTILDYCTDVRIPRPRVTCRYNAILINDTSADVAITNVGTSVVTKATSATEVAGQYYVFIAHNRGIIPSILDDLLSARAAIRKKMKALVDANPNAKDLFEYILFDQQQNSMKISCNSVYGFFGADEQRARLPCLAVAASTTAEARRVIQATKNLVCEKYNAELLYGDTDSIMVRFKRPEDNKSVQHVMNLATEAANFITNFFEGKAKLTFEKVYCPWLLWGKKKYAGICCKFGESSEIHSRGLFIRRDILPVVRKCMEESITLICNDPINGPKAAANYVRKEFITALADVTIKLDQLALTKSLGSNYAKPECMIPFQVASLIKSRNPGSEPLAGDRVAFAIKLTENSMSLRSSLKYSKNLKPKARKKDEDLIAKQADDPGYIAKTGAPLDLLYYLLVGKIPIMKIFMFFESPTADLHIWFEQAQLKLMKWSRMQLQLISTRRNGGMDTLDNVFRKRG